MISARGGEFQRVERLEECFTKNALSMFQRVGRGGRSSALNTERKDKNKMIITLEYVRFLIEMTTDLLDELNTMENELIENESIHKEDDIEKAFYPAYVVRSSIEKEKAKG